jgi:predicted GH43/DUF377 family glycosyl hydrolase
VNELGIAKRIDLVLRADATRVVTRLFFPGQELIGGSESRNARTIARVMALSDAQVDVALAELIDRFAPRHEDIASTFEDSADAIVTLAPADSRLSPARRRLLGAAFTHEFSIEGAAVCNPSVVPHFDQTETEPGSLRVIMSYRAIGEGHRSAIGFRPGTVSNNGEISIEEPARFPTIAKSSAVTLSQAQFHSILAETDSDGDTAASVLDSLGNSFTLAELESAVSTLTSQSDTRLNASSVAAQLLAIAQTCYSLSCRSSEELSRRVLWPTTTQESQGMEDARFVNMRDADGCKFIATYAAYDGTNVMQRLLETDDFCSFRSTPLTGVAARNKGLAIFPRKINGMYTALSRHDRESNSISSSESLHHWGDAVTIQNPVEPWEMVQLGNCGSPIELVEGWLVLTHGVGPMRTYGIGALLLDLNDPARVIGRLRLPLLSPSHDEQDGYVPNVVYSCGSLVHHDHLITPYGRSDSSIGFAVTPVSELLDRLVH